jgi:endonuclease YncB( thermonuclease family)
MQIRITTALPVRHHHKSRSQEATMRNNRRTAVMMAVVPALAAASMAVAASPAEAATHPKITTTARVGYVVDGDTIRLANGAYVRVIGIDTPERGDCGYGKATRHAKKVLGSRVRLVNPASVKDRDKYGRLLRYVETLGGRDLGLAQIKDGARARYDGRDGYQRHPRQGRYHNADAHHTNYRCGGGGGGSQPYWGYWPISTYRCPASAPIKGNESSMIYHMPGQAYYAVTTPEYCFKTQAAARWYGFRPAKV